MSVDSSTALVKIYDHGDINNSKLPCEAHEAIVPALEILKDIPENPSPPSIKSALSLSGLWISSSGSVTAPINEPSKFDGWDLQKYRSGIHGIISFVRDKIDIQDVCDKLSQSSDVFKKATFNILNILLQPLEESREKAFESYQKFIDILRIALTLPEYSQEIEKRKKNFEYDICIDYLFLICQARFAEVNIHPLAHEMVATTIKDGLERLGITVEHNNFVDLDISRQFDGIEAAEKQWTLSQRVSNRLSSSLNLGFDPHRWYNMPYVAGDVSIMQNIEAHKMRILRFATPTQQGFSCWEYLSSNDATIIPEFKCFLDNLFFKKEKYIYVGLQDERNSYFNREFQRCEALKKLNSAYKETFIFINFSQDSDFYYQSSSKCVNKTALNFKEEFISELLSEDKGFWFAESIKNLANFVRTLEDVFNYVHYDIFDSKIDLSYDERLDFIEIAQIYLAIILSLEVNAIYLGFHCRDSKDRGAKSTGLMQAWIGFLIGKGNDFEQKTKFMINTHLPALQASQEAMNSRKSRFISVLERFNESETQKRLLLRNHRFGFIDHYC